MCNYKHSQKRKDRIDKLNIVWVVRRSNLKIFKNSFYSDFVLQSIIKMFEPFGVWQGGGITSLKVADKTVLLYVR